MTLNEKKPSLLFGIDYETETEISVVMTDPDLLMIAELFCENSTVRDRKAFYKLYPGAPDYEELYEHEFAAEYNRVREFANTYNLAIEILEA